MHLFDSLDEAPSAEDAAALTSLSSGEFALIRARAGGVYVVSERGSYRTVLHVTEGDATRGQWVVTGVHVIGEQLRSNTIRDLPAPTLFTQALDAVYALSRPAVGGRLKPAKDKTALPEAFAQDRRGSMKRTDADYAQLALAYHHAEPSERRYLPARWARENPQVSAGTLRNHIGYLKREGFVSPSGDATDQTFRLVYGKTWKEIEDADARGDAWLDTLPRTRPVRLTASERRKVKASGRDPERVMAENVTYNAKVRQGPHTRGDRDE